MARKSFADQVTGDLLEGEATPAFSGTPSREGYVFAGWNPAVSATVSGDVTYTATWKPDRNGNGIADEEEQKYTVTYTDGVEGEEIFADQVTGDLLEGEATPAFNGTLERQGYVFAGWNPAVSATVSGDVTYTATWMKESTGERDSYDPSEIARKLAAGKAVEGLVTDRFGTAMPYAPLTKRTLDTASGKEIQRTLVITADPVRDENGEIVLRDGAPVYEQRNLHLSRGLLDALAETWLHAHPLCTRRRGARMAAGLYDRGRLHRAPRAHGGRRAFAGGKGRHRRGGNAHRQLPRPRHGNDRGRGSGRDQRHPQPDGHL